MQYLFDGFFPVNAPTNLIIIWTGKIQPSIWPELVEKCKTRSLRQVARQYGLSLETVKRIRMACDNVCFTDRRP